MRNNKLTIIKISIIFAFVNLCISVICYTVIPTRTVQNENDND